MSMQSKTVNASEYTLMPSQDVSIFFDNNYVARTGTTTGTDSRYRDVDSRYRDGYHGADIGRTQKA